MFLDLCINSKNYIYLTGFAYSSKLITLNAVVDLIDRIPSPAFCCGPFGVPDIMISQNYNTSNKDVFVK